MAFFSTLHLFCRVIDNFGDIGVCWRLACQLQHEHGIAVTLWVDNLSSFRRICSAIDPEQGNQRVQNVTVRLWNEEFDTTDSPEVADIVIEAFACDLPSTYVAAMAVRTRKPVWINLEYLSAESWVEGCHAMASHHPFLPLTKYFFFPGFSAKTGGLLVEKNLAVRRQSFQVEPKLVQAFFANLGVHVPEAARKVSLFCYPDGPVESLFNAMRSEDLPTLCLVPEGVTSNAIAAFLGQPVKAGACATHGALTVHILPFVDQPDYDKLLWACDLNFVRGEDSFVRAQWAARPFIWHIYAQDDDAHRKKLEAFLTRYKTGMADSTADMLSGMWFAWNYGTDVAGQWHSFNSAMPELCRHAVEWSQQVSQNGDLASNLVQFVTEIS